MIDHLCTYKSEAAALADPMLAAYRAGSGWDESVTIPGIRVYRVVGVTTVVDPESGAVEQEITEDLPGWRILVSAAARDPVLVAPGCTLVTDRDAAASGAPCVLHSTMPLSALADLRLTPWPAGAVYPSAESLAFA